MVVGDGEHLGAEARFELASLDYGPSKEPLLHSAICEATLTDSGDPKRRRHLYTAYAHEPYCGATAVPVLGIPELICPEFCAAPHGYCCIAVLSFLITNHDLGLEVET